jgi:hypothetical protein
MVATTVTEFAKRFGRYKEEAQREPVAITSRPCAMSASGDSFFIFKRDTKICRLLRDAQHAILYR